MRVSSPPCPSPLPRVPLRPGHRAAVDDRSCRPPSSSCRDRPLGVPVLWHPWAQPDPVFTEVRQVQTMRRIGVPIASGRARAEREPIPWALDMDSWPDFPAPCPLEAILRPNRLICGLSGLTWPHGCLAASRVAPVVGRWGSPPAGLYPVRRPSRSAPGSPRNPWPGLELPPPGQHTVPHTSRSSLRRKVPEQLQPPPVPSVYWAWHDDPDATTPAAGTTSPTERFRSDPTSSRARTSGLSCSSLQGRCGVGDSRCIPSA